MAIDQLNVSQQGKEQLINELFDALLGKFVLGIHRSATIGLTFTVYGGLFKGLTLADQALTLAPSNTSFIQANATTGVLSAATGVVTASQVTNGGSTYGTVPTVVYTLIGGGVAPTGTATISGGSVTGIFQNTPGSGLTAMPLITFTGGGGTGATAIATGYTLGAIKLGVAITSATGLTSYTPVDRENWPVA